MREWFHLILIPKAELCQQSKRIKAWTPSHYHAGALFIHIGNKGMEIISVDPCLQGADRECTDQFAKVGPMQSS